MRHHRRHHNRSARTKLSVWTSRCLYRGVCVAALLSAAATALSQDTPSATPPSSAPPDAATRTSQPDAAAATRSSSSTPGGAAPRISRAPRIPSPREELLKTLYGADFGSYVALPLTEVNPVASPASAQDPFRSPASLDPQDRRWDPPSALRPGSLPISFGTLFPDADRSLRPGGYGPRSAILHESNAAGFSASLKAKLDAILARPTLPGSSSPGFGLEDPLLRFGVRSALFTGQEAGGALSPGSRQPLPPTTGLSIAPPAGSISLMTPAMSIPSLTAQTPGFSLFQPDRLNPSPLMKLEHASSGLIDLFALPPDMSRRPTREPGTSSRN